MAALHSKGLELPLLAFVSFVLACFFISGTTGEVPDGVVYTDLHRKAQMGSRTVLKCQFYGTPLAVYWKKGDDPRTSPDLISWVEGVLTSGTCLKDKSCEMGDNHALIIRNVSIADQGRYICRVSNYRGILIHNFTDVTVFAVPEEPFPAINLCMGNRRENCTVNATNSLNITCTVSRYFPDVDLFFLHGEHKLKTIQTSEWTHADRTKTKAISTSAQPSDIPYVCVAFNIPGSRDQRTATVFTTTAETRFSSTVTAFQHVPVRGNVTKIVLPIVITVSGVVVAVVIYAVLRKKHGGNRRKGGDDGESQPMIQRMDIKEHLSYYELWMLVSHAKARGDRMMKLRDTFNLLQITAIKSDCTRREAYHALCDWKDKEKGNQRDILKEALEKADYTKAWEYLCELREKKGSNNPTVSPGTCKQIIWQIGNTNQINRFLSELIPDGKVTIRIHDTEKMGKVAEYATNILKDWSRRLLGVNQMVLLSTALERAGCTSLGKTFFTGDDGESQPMQRMDIKGHLSYYELWMLVSHAKARGDRMMKLRDTFNILQITAIKSDCARREAYNALCDWKDKQKGNQRDILKEALETADYTKAWEYLRELREKKGSNNPTVSPGTCKQIICQIENTNQISRFLCELIPDGEATIRIHDNEKIGKVAEYATDVLKDWSRSLLGVNQMVLLSTALERAGCTSLGKTFFTGYLSYYELWMLVSHPHAGGDHMRKLRDTFNVLQITGIKSDFTPIDAYHALCDWKDKQERNQLDTLKEALEKADYTRAWKYIYELREKKGSNDPTVSQDTFKQIIWQIGNTNPINRFLCELIPDRSTTIDIPATGKIGEVVKGVNDVWKDWSTRSFEVNQMVLLSIALERAGCASLGKTFFTVPSELLSVPPKEVDTFTEKLTSRHCKRLAATLKISKKMNNIIEENYSLFDTRLMVTEWLSDMECSNYEKRCRLDDAINKIGRYDLEDFWGTVSYRRSAGAFQERPYVQSDKFDHEKIYDDDIPQLVTLIEHLPPDKKKEIYNKIGYDTSGEGAVKDRNRVEEKLKEWRNKILENNSKEEALKEFQLLREDTIKGTKYDGMTLTDGEIEIVATRVKTTPNQQILKEKLQIEASVQPDSSFADQLKIWRNTDKKPNCRDTLREALTCIGLTECIVKKNPMECVYQAEIVEVAFDLLMEDIRPIIHALGIDQARVRRYIRPMSKLENKGTMGLMVELMKGKIIGTERDRNDFCKHALRNNGFVDVGRSVYLDYVPSLSELINIISLIEDDKILCFLGHIGLNQNDIAECQKKEGKTDMLELMRLWKHHIRPVPYHYRLELASALEASGLYGIAGDVLSGRLQTRAPHQSVLRNICRRLDDEMLAVLSNVLETGGNSNRNTITSSVIKWVEWWMENFDPKATGPLSSHMSDRKKMNDRLFSHGFVELAQEITALEHCRP